MQANLHNRTIAMAGLFQCVEGVAQLANKGHLGEQHLKTCIDSLLIDDADSAEALYGGLENLKIGLSTMLYQLGSGQITPDGKPKDMEITRYAIGLLHLEKKLDKHPDAFNEIMTGISDAQQQLEFFDSTHTNMIARLAELYSNTISNIGPKILVKGDQNHLQNPDNAAKIRSLLLAGIRAALLWQQAGGSRWKLFFERGQLQKQADSLLQKI